MILNLFDAESDIFADIIANPTDPLNLAILIVGGLICVVAIFSVFISIYLMIKYIKFNRKQNSAQLTGQECARKLLDLNDLQKIRVSKNGSILFGNSYSHYFKKVRLRRLTWKKKSVTSLAMAAQKTGLAVLAKEGDKDMKTRIVLTPIICFGPYAFIPLIVIGILLDLIVLNSTVPVCTLTCTLLGIGFFVLSFVLSIMQLKTEVKAQEKAYQMLQENNLATAEELGMMKELFHLYNIEYVNNIILAFLELIYRILMLIAQLRGGSSISTSND